MTRNILFVMFFIAAFAGSATAQKEEGQEYKNAVGLKVYPLAFTIKHNFNHLVAVEGITYFYGGRSVRETALLEFNFDIEKVEGLRWFAGPGAHISFTKYYNGSKTFVGLDGILGVDYKFKGLPINVSADWQPSFEFGEQPSINNVPVGIKDGPGFTGSWAGIAVRFTF